jgi:hypothetical protein
VNTYSNSTRVLIDIPEIAAPRADLATCEPSECIDKASRDGHIVQTGSHSHTSSERLNPRCHFSIAGRQSPVPTYPLPTVSLSQPRLSLSTPHHRHTYEGGQLPIRRADGPVATIDGLFEKDGWKLYQGKNEDTGMTVLSLLVDINNQLSRVFEGNSRDWLVAVSEQGIFSGKTYVNVGNGGMEPFYGKVGVERVGVED